MQDWRPCRDRNNASSTSCFPAYARTSRSFALPVCAETWASGSAQRCVQRCALPFRVHALFRGPLPPPIASCRAAVATAVRRTMEPSSSYSLGPFARSVKHRSSAPTEPPTVVTLARIAHVVPDPVLNYADYAPCLPLLAKSPQVDPRLILASSARCFRSCVTDVPWPPLLTDVTASYCSTALPLR
jgi:hypothetical protein